MNDYFTWAEGLDYTLGVVGGQTGTWYDSYVSYIESQGLDRYTDFSANLSTFLGLPQYKEWRAHVTCTTDYDTCTEIR